MRFPHPSHRVATRGLGRAGAPVGVTARVPVTVHFAACALCAILLFIPACGGPTGPVFNAGLNAPAWPPAPDAPRIRYLGELTGEASLKMRPGGLKALAAVVTGPAPQMAFSTPTAVAASGDLVYVADGQNACVYILDLQKRTIQRIAEAGGRPLQWPCDLVLADGNLAILDSQRAALFIFDLQGHYLRTLGEGVLKRPAGAAWQTDAKRFWITDAAEHAICILDASGGAVTRSGGRGTAVGQLNFPAGLTCRAPFGGAVADALNFRVQWLDPAGAMTGGFGGKGDAAGRFALPRDVAFDSEGHLYVLDSQFENIQIFDRDGRLLMAFGQEGRKPGEFYLPSGLCIDDRDRLWVADTYNRRVQVFQYLTESGSARPSAPEVVR